MPRKSDSGLIYAQCLPKSLFYFSRFKKTNIKAGSSFVLEGDKSSNVYFLEKGLTAISCCHHNNTKINLFLAGHSFINDIDIFCVNNLPSFKIYTFTDTVLWTMPCKDFLTFLDKDVELFDEVANCMSRKNRKMTDQLYNLRFNSAEDRLSSFIKEFWKICIEKRLPTCLPPQRIIAEALALHRVTVTKVLKRIAYY